MKLTDVFAALFLSSWAVAFATGVACTRAQVDAVVPHVIDAVSELARELCTADDSRASCLDKCLSAAKERDQEGGAVAGVPSSSATPKD